METAQRKRRFELVTLSGYSIAFKHEIGEWPRAVYRKGQKVEIVAKRRTLCFITKAVSETPVVQGEAYCLPPDTFEHEVGRQYALMSAMRSLPKGSQLGGELKETYLQRTGAQPWRIVNGSLALPRPERLTLNMDDDGHLVPNGPVTRKDRLKIAMAIGTLIKDVLVKDVVAPDAEQIAQQTQTLNAIADMLGILAAAR